MTAGLSEARVAVCTLDAVPREGGVAALVHGEAVAVFRTHDDEVFALSNVDPVSRASVMARGILGTRGDAPFVAGPLYKQPWGLRDGVCLDDADLRVATYDVVVEDGTIWVGGRRT
ncbi:nitrite reductase small subunit NirD [Nocardioides sp. HDW12B]|uniref:nitrite reductase small subunit NirD n=1 Tax=Nocardioides sp. HDW12B TaxID=2714939 RepID=UPI00140CECFE|nr:nitrite reductase small subunit NirD [Nocardioides sp. HDW12B]QIK67508.1 nitrite reductase small subunit NirD [Nocardioides sp. HDW12B]